MRNNFNVVNKYYAKRYIVAIKIHNIILLKLEGNSFWSNYVWSIIYLNL